MAPELSSNWKKIQAKIKQESPRRSQGAKRKAGDSTLAAEPSTAAKKRKVRANKQAKGGLAVSANDTKASKTSRKPSMGAVQSQVAKPGIPAPLALWAEENDISTEALAEAYGLGTKDNSMLTATAARPNEGLAKDVEPGKYIAIDCEMVGVGDGGYDHALARVSAVDFHGRQVYDSYVRPKERVTDWRTHVSGITPKHMVIARSFGEVQAELARLLRGRIVVGHDIRHDLEALILDHPKKDIRDTAKFSGFKKFGHGPKPALRVLAREILGVDIQEGQHSSIEDARVTMLLFRRHKPAFDAEQASRYPDNHSQSSVSTTKAKPKRTRKKRRN